MRASSVRIDVVARLGRVDALFALDHALHVLAQHAPARCTAQVLVHALLDLRFPFHIRLVERVLTNVGQQVDVDRCAHVTEHVGGQGAIDVLPHRLDRDLHPRQADVVLGKLRDGGEVDFLLVGERHERVVAVVRLEVLGIVVRRQVEFLEPRDHGVVHDLDDIRFVNLRPHLLDVLRELHHRRPAKFAPVAAHHVGQVKLDFVAGAIGHERDAVAIPDFAAHARDAHGDLGAVGDFMGPDLPAGHLLPPQLGDEDAKAAQDDESQKNEA